MAVEAYDMHMWLYDDIRESPEAYPDPEVFAVAKYISDEDPGYRRLAEVLRQTFDQLYDGQHTGRYSYRHLAKTERTHMGSLVEINLQREFQFEDGQVMDFNIAGVEVDCKYSASGAWMLPLESLGHVILVISAVDEDFRWSAGVVRVSPENIRTSKNRDLKTTLNKTGKKAILWFVNDGELPPNILLDLDSEVIDRIFSKKSGQQKINELFRSAPGRPISRNVVATVGMQKDYMKRVRANGGARDTLGKEGMIILNGEFNNQALIAQGLGLEVPRKNEFISAYVVPTEGEGVKIAGRCWRLARPGEQINTVAPRINETKKE